MSVPLFKKILLAILLVGITLPTFFCTEKKEEATAEPQQSPWKNVYDTSAKYVGIETCRSCHSDIYETYIKTGMGQSFDHATKEKSAAVFDEHALVYDKQNDFYYKPYWNNDSLYINEYRLEGKDTMHKRTQKIDYIIGSGQHTNSHIYSENGYLYQAPITFYTQKKKWDLAPGFEKTNERFSRIIESECMTCHNGYPDFVFESQNKYLNVKTGIDCERCHGPGSLHVAEKQAGIIVDTSKTPDYTIVNPRRLSTELQNNICQRCHLQGIAVLNDGKTFFDFRPGMKLSEVMNVFMPQYEGAEDKMIMASHVERMKKSPCYVNSGKMSCITCHDPHVSVKFTPREQYLNACYSCHSNAKGKSENAKLESHGCTEKESVRAVKNNDCVTCHMPSNGSIDIPHVAVTDHFIRKQPVNNLEQSKIRAFLGLQSFNNDSPDAITQARAFMEFFERYNPNTGLIDSALFYLAKQSDVAANEKQNRDNIRAYFLLNNFNKVAEYGGQLDATKLADAWACYRVGESYYQLQQPDKALNWYKRATEIWKYALDFQNKYGTCLLALNRMEEAKQVFEFVLKENENHVAANTNLGFIYMQQGQNTMAYNHIRKAQRLDPDYEQNLINLAVWYHNNEQDNLARKTLQHAVKKHPDNEQARAMLMDLQ
ncbi:MAG TPA: cytochrome c3 family protein [Flavipsychrobacter sp.]|nr:cytochrome c3 family protein [Flavipsychrobacter sp.]